MASGMRAASSGSCVYLTLVHRAPLVGYTHGAAIFKTCHAAAALAGVSLQEFVQDPYGRSLWAAMIREGLYVRRRVEV